MKIKTKKEYLKVLDKLSKIMSKIVTNEKEFLDLCDAVEEYEKKHFPIKSDNK